MTKSCGMKTAICCGAALAVIVVRYSTRRKPSASSRVSECISLWLSSQAERPVLNPEVQRSQFNSLDLIRHTANPMHTHGESAAHRSSSTNFARRLAESIGLRPFFFQSSRSDQRRGFEGSRIHFWAKDFNGNHNRTRITEEHMLVMIDTDYYLDMPATLTDAFAHTILYSFQPDAASASRTDYSYTFTADQEVQYYVTGGGQYQHRLWNYGFDCITTTKKIFGFTYKSAIYLVDRRRVSDDHYLVGLTPVARWHGLSAFLSTWMGGNQLSRLEPVVGQFTRLYSQGKNGLQVSTARVGTFACGTVSAATDDAIASIARNSTVKTNLSSIQGHLPDSDNIVAQKAQAAALLAYHREHSTIGWDPRTLVFPVEEAIRSYEIDSKSPSTDPKETLTAFMSPILHGAFAPLDNKANEEWCIQGRITNFRRDKPLVPSQYMEDLMTEFSEHLIPVPHTLDPVVLDVVYERQNRPSQRRILAQSETERPHRVAKSFMKREAYADVKDPRPITTINGPDKRDYSTFIYPISDILKTTRWYAFGKTPREIAIRVCEVLARATTAINTDFSRFDGRVSMILRTLERKILTRAYKRGYLGEVLDLHRSQHNLRGKGRHGTRYTSDAARLSGSPETACFNSIDNAFVAYVTLRSEPFEGRRRTPREAWDALGIYGGDDGLTANVSTTESTRSSDMVGLVLECDEVKRGNFGITFLSRIYGPNVWYGDPTTCCDLPRQLTKYHTTVNLPGNVTCLEKHREKARSFHLSDKNTPIIGPLVSKTIELFGEAEMTEKTLGMRKWDSEGTEDVQYPNEAQDWMATYAEDALAKYNFDHQMFNEWINNATADNILSPPLCGEILAPKTKVKVHVDGELIRPSKSKKKNGPPGQTKAPERVSGRTRRRRSAATATAPERGPKPNNENPKRSRRQRKPNH